jgi:hypothetical protein
VFAISWEVREQVVYLSSARLGARTSQDNTLVEDDRGVFDEAAVWVVRESRELDYLITELT